MHPFKGPLQLQVASRSPHPAPQWVLLTVMEDSFGCPGHEAQHRVGVMSHEVRMSQGGDVTWDE